MECETQFQPCRTKAACNAAGKCEYRTDDWRVQKEGGICVKPWDYSGIAQLADNSNWWEDPRWEQCSTEAMQRLDPTISWVEWREFGCILFFGGEDFHHGLVDASAKKQHCEGTLMGKWFRYAWTESDCAQAGWAWSQGVTANTWQTGSHMCCLRWFGEGHDTHCEHFSMDNNLDSCTDCGGRWMSIFRYRLTGHWVVGQWKKAYTWESRRFEPANRWIDTIERHKLEEYFSMIVSKTRGAPLKNFVFCRLNHTISALIAMVTGTPLVPQIGEVKILPGQSLASDVGSFGFQTTAATNGGTVEQLFQMFQQPASNNIVAGDPAPGRRLSVSNLESALIPSCYSTVKDQSHGDKIIGQLVGDCLEVKSRSNMNGAASLCLPLDSTIPVNAAFTLLGLAKTNTETKSIQVLSTTITSSNDLRVCGNIFSLGTYCPVKTYPRASMASAPSAASGCPGLASVTAGIVALAEATEVDVVGPGGAISETGTIGGLMNGGGSAGSGGSVDIGSGTSDGTNDGTSGSTIVIDTGAATEPLPTPPPTTAGPTKAGAKIITQKLEFKVSNFESFPTPEKYLATLPDLPEGTTATMTYKIELSMSFSADTVVDEDFARSAVASSLNVAKGQVTVTITLVAGGDSSGSGRLRRLQTVKVDSAVETTNQAEAVFVSNGASSATFGTSFTAAYAESGGESLPTPTVSAPELSVDVELNAIIDEGSTYVAPSAEDQAAALSEAYGENLISSVAEEGGSTDSTTPASVENSTTIATTTSQEDEEDSSAISAKEQRFQVVVLGLCIPYLLSFTV
jgi:hypothetical protein